MKSFAMKQKRTKYVGKVSEGMEISRKFVEREEEGEEFGWSLN
jgi:hypothetical protein